MSEDEKALSIIKPQSSVVDVKKDLQAIQRLLKSAMEEGHDYGVIPGTQEKTLYDPGAEKLSNFFKLIPDYELMDSKEDMDKGFFFYRYKCKLIHFHTGKFAGSSERSCNSFEKKFLTKTVSEKWASEEDKKNTIGRKQNDKGYTMLIVKKSVYELIEGMNTYMARAQKRAFVEAVRTATMASSIFRSDGIDNEEAPNAPATKEENPERVKVMASLFATAADRGFNPEKVKKAVYDRFNVTTMEMVSNKDLNVVKEYMETTWDVVGKGNPPKKLNTDSSQTSPKPPETKQVVEELKNPFTAESSGVEEGELVETAPELPWEEEERLKREKDGKKIDDEETPGTKRKCYNCEKEIESTTDWFCDQKCKDEYWEKKHPKSAEEKKREAEREEKKKAIFNKGAAA